MKFAKAASMLLASTAAYSVAGFSIQNHHRHPHVNSVAVVGHRQGNSEQSSSPLKLKMSESATVEKNGEETFE